MKSISVVLFVVSSTLVGCQSSEKKAERPLVDSKYSLSADRQALDDLRKQVPDEKKRENDELALVLDLVSESKTELKKSPSEIRGQFDSLLRKKREKFDKDMSKEREIFTREERKKREEFLKSQQTARNTFSSQKHTRDEKNDFYKNLDEKRSEHFSAERDHRNDYESDVRERRKSFEDYTREKTNEFNQELRAYQKRYDEAKKERETLAKSKTNPISRDRPGSSEVEELNRELQEIKSKTGTNLESGE